MPYSEFQIATLDLNWYFVDYFNRICVGASAGGKLPNVIIKNDKENELFNAKVQGLPKRYPVARNESTLEFIKNINSNGVEDYYKNFEELASRGLYVFDKVNIEQPNEGIYLLVTYPVYNTLFDSVPMEKDDLKMVPRLKRSIITRFNQKLSPINFRPIDLVNIVNNS